MPYLYFALSALCFIAAGILEFRRRKATPRSKTKPSTSGRYVTIESVEASKDEKSYEVSKARDQHESHAQEDSSGKFDHLFKIKPEMEKSEARDAGSRDDILKEAENLPEIPKIGTEESFEPLYFRVSEAQESGGSRQEMQDASHQQAQQSERTAQQAEPKDWLFFDPSKLEDEEQRDKKKEDKKEEDSSWMPSFFFGDES